MKIYLALLLALSSLALAPARGDITLDLAPAAGGDTVNVAAGETFQLILSMTVATESVVGYSSFLSVVESEAGGLFTIVDRDITGSPFTAAFFTNAEVANPSFSSLAPKNGRDLGASVADPGTPVGPGTHLLATYTLRLSEAAKVGSFTIATAHPGTIATIIAPAAAGGFGAFFLPPLEDQQVAQSLALVNVVPEPATGLLLAAGLAALGLCRRR